MERQRIKFETNVDDLVDANERYWTRTTMGRSQRRRGVLAAGVAFTVSLFATTFVFTGGTRDAVAPLAGIALLLGAAFLPLYGRLYDGGLHWRLRRVVTELAGNERTWICEIELREEGVWSRGRGIELQFDWDGLNAIEDTKAAIEFHFSGGFVMARNRAFATGTERERFLDTARTLAGNS